MEEPAVTSDGGRQWWTAKRIARGVFGVWVFAYMGPKVCERAQYVIWYTVVVGTILLVIRNPVAGMLRESPVPNVVWFVSLSLILCAVEVGIRVPICSVNFALQTLALFGWALGVLICGRFLRLGMVELWLVTGLAGWFQEVVFFDKLVIVDQFWRSILVMGWGVWAYAMLVLIPVTLIPGPDAKTAESGRWWRHLVAFVVPILLSRLACIIGMKIFGAPS